MHYAVDRLVELTEQPDALMDKIITHVANGGSLTTLAAIWEVRYSDLMRWIREDKRRLELYKSAIEDRNEWAQETFLHEIRMLSTSDLRDLFMEDGSIKPVHLWPESIARSVSSIETNELFAGYGSERELIGHAKKLKLWDKLKAIELGGKNLKLFTDKHEVSGRITLEDLVVGANTSEQHAIETRKIEQLEYRESEEKTDEV